MLTLSVAAVLATSAVTAQACDRQKSPTAAASNTKSCPASACAAKSSATARNTAATKKAKGARSTTVATAKKAAPATAGMRAYRDPETGTFGAPTVTGVGEDGVVVVKDSPAVLTEVALPNGGGYMVDLQGTGQDYATMRIGAKGKRVMTCAPARDAKKVIAPAASSTSFPEK